MGLFRNERTYKAEIINTAEYMKTKYKKDPFVNIVKSHESTQTNTSSTIKAAANVAQELNQSNENGDTNNLGIQHIKAKLGESLKKIWDSKIIHGQYIKSMDRQLFRQEDTFLWLSRGVIKGETGSEIIAAKDHAFQTKYHATKILQTETDRKRRLWK